MTEAMAKMINATKNQNQSVEKSFASLNSDGMITEIARITSTWFATSNIFEGCDTKYINESATLKDNLVGEAVLAGKRGGANRIRVYVNKRNDVLTISIRYGNNMPYHSDVLELSKTITTHVQDVAKDGKTESRIQFSAIRYKLWIRGVENIVNADVESETELKKAMTVESVTA